MLPIKVHTGKNEINSTKILPLWELNQGPLDHHANALLTETKTAFSSQSESLLTFKSCLRSIDSKNDQSPKCEVVHETKTHFRNLLLNTYLPGQAWNPRFILRDNLLFCSSPSMVGRILPEIGRNGHITTEMMYLKLNMRCYFFLSWFLQLYLSHLQREISQHK